MSHDRPPPRRPPGALPAPPVRAVHAGVRRPDAQGPRIAAVERAMRQLAALDPGPLGQGLSRANARHCLQVACAAMSAEALRGALATGGERKVVSAVVVVVAEGVFTAPIEWAAIYAAAGLRVHLKAPESGPALCGALAQALHDQGLQLTSSTSRDLRAGLGRTPPAIVAFGADSTASALRAAWPTSKVVGFGHRFGIAVLAGGPTPAAVSALVEDVIAYDTRGCMAPVAAVVIGDPVAWVGPLAGALARAELERPRGTIGTGVGPAWRTRVALGRALGRCEDGGRWAVRALPFQHLEPTPLPRMISLHAVPLSALGAALRAHAPHLGTCGVWGLPPGHPAFAGIGRVCALGQMQRPTVPRAHDGVPMLACLAR